MEEKMKKLFEYLGFCFIIFKEGLKYETHIPFAN